eukprot:scaffold245_cov256-Pinguiococcus_pyrenoidosus.AAC.33
MSGRATRERQAGDTGASVRQCAAVAAAPRQLSRPQKQEFLTLPAHPPGTISACHKAADSYPQPHACLLASILACMMMHGKEQEVRLIMAACIALLTSRQGRQGGKPLCTRHACSLRGTL